MGAGCRALCRFGGSIAVDGTAVAAPVGRDEIGGALHLIGAAALGIERKDSVSSGEANRDQKPCNFCRGKGTAESLISGEMVGRYEVLEGAGSGGI